jgi:hypothetical protein
LGGTGLTQIDNRLAREMALSDLGCSFIGPSSGAPSMDAMSRAMSSSAAIRATSSICSHGGGFVGVFGLGGGSVSSRNARCNCMAAPLMRRRLRGPAEESVDERAQAEQIIKPAEIVGNVGSWGAELPRLRIPISPGSRDERAGAVWQDRKNETHATSADTGDYCKRSALKWVPLARNHH